LRFLNAVLASVAARPDSCATISRADVAMSSPVTIHPFTIPLHLGRFEYELSGFGIAVLLAFLIAQVVSERELRRRGYDHEARHLPDVLLAAVLGTLIGGKLYYVAVITHDWHDLLSRAGFVFWGGFIGAVIACWMMIRARHLPFARYADVAGIAIAAGYAVGRTGCWAVGDDYGKWYEGPLAVAFPQGIPPSTVGNMTATFHAVFPPALDASTIVGVVPTQLIEVALGFIMFVVLWRLRRHRHADGWLLGVYGVLAGAERFAVEFLRIKDDRFFALSVAQCIAIAVFVLGVIVMRARSGPAARPDGGIDAARAAARVLSVSIILAAACVGTSSTAQGQGRCIRAYGTPACNTDPIKPVFDRTGWRTTKLDHITFRVAEPEKEAAFYSALMGWRVRTSDTTRVVMDIGDWGTAVFRRAPAESFAVPAQGGGGRERAPVRAVVEGIGFAVEPWNAGVVERELRKRGLAPVADNDGRGFESFHIKDPDGFDVQIGNGRRPNAGGAAKSAAAAVGAPFEATGWQTVWLDHLSYGVANYKASASFYSNLLGWGPTYDEGSQNELMIGDVGDIIVRGGNPLDPAFGQVPSRRAGRIDHISFGISPWDTDSVKAGLERRGLDASIDTSDGAEIHVAQYKSYHTTTPNGYNLQISSSTHDTRLNLALAVNPRRPGVR
jgi:phosphatidylglycerol:prolipoprotein diacylglycerol transferase